MIPGSANPLLLAAAAEEAAGYQISRSLRFNSSDSAYCVRTPASSSNRQKYTWSGWVKRSTLAAKSHVLFTGYSNDFQYTFIAFNSSDQILVNDYQSGANQITLVTTSVYRDPSAWYHIVLAVDTTIASPSSDRVKLYVNGAQVTTFSTATYPSQNLSTNINNNTTHYLGHFSIANATNNYFNGYLADIHFIDGQALDPTSFTEVDATTGQLVPIAYTGTYGTNGFHLPFSDNSTAAALGTDTSGNSNTWTVNNISVTAGAGNDSLVDTPTSYGTDTGAGGEVRGNYCTLNPLTTTLGGGSGTSSNGNLEWLGTGSNDNIAGTFAASSGKWYYELEIVSNYQTLVAGWSTTEAATHTTTSALFYYESACIRTGNKTSVWNTDVTTGLTFGNGDIVGFAIDIDSSELKVYQNNSLISTITLPTDKGNEWLPCFGDSSATDASFIVNFGQRPFAYTAPSGFKALCTANLDAPVVTKPSEVMDVKLYTGNGTSQSITGLGFSPDFVWIKSRTSTNGHNLYDSVRGANKYLSSHLTAAEGTATNELMSFDSNGFTLGSAAGVNSGSNTYVGWTWDAGSSTVTNTDGSITSSVRANPTAGFSIVTYTGNGITGASVGHGLNTAPSLIICKNRDNSAGVWYTYHADLGYTKYLRLNTTNAAATYTIVTSTSSTVFAGGNDSIMINNERFVAYCFAPVDGYSSFGSFTGNGSTDGPFVYTGFRPRFVLFKCTSDSNSWQILDTARDTFNEATKGLFPNLSNAEISNGAYDLDMLSNGIKIRTSDQYFNGSGKTFLIAAFAESPFKTARAR